MATDGYVKIGHTTDTLSRRLKNYATHSPDTPEVLGYVGGSKDDENWFHQRFARYRYNGEWFRNEGELRHFIENGLQTLQDETERLRLDYLRDGLEGRVEKLPPKFPRKPKPVPPAPGRKLIYKDGKIFNLQGKRVLSPKPGDYFVEA